MNQYGGRYFFNSSNTIPFPTLTIVYLVSQAEGLIDEISQKYNNITVEDCNGFFNDGLKRDYKKITIWSQGIDSLWFNALIARIKEIANVDSVPIVSGGIMYSSVALTCFAIIFYSNTINFVDFPRTNSKGNRFLNKR